MPRAKTERTVTSATRLLKGIRAEHGMSAQEVADACGVHRNTIYRIESGRWSASVVVFERILDALGYELDVMKKGSQ